MIIDTPIEPVRVPYDGDCVMLDANNQWWFWDETYAPYGPYESEHEARVELALYCHFCL